MALDTGSSDLLIDESAARRYRVDRVPGQRIEFWSGSRVAVRNAMVQRLEIGAFRIERLPAGTLSLRKWSIEVNPQSEPAVGVIGLEYASWRSFQASPHDFDHEQWISLGFVKQVHD